MQTEGFFLRLAFEIGEDDQRPFEALGLVIGQDGDGVRGAARGLLSLLLGKPGAKIGHGRRRAILFALVLIGGDQGAQSLRDSASDPARRPSA